ncbi:putative uridine nucleosidase [Mollisia scopiformis]|uniref:Putative uridine nucleosidase n=1 Tax=Mollisia scopiformis TaxID=149040 RepID=A0A194XEK2_MOLSC|nr:putative uridine nucleosidase [Mollisia scopiformis]KUJ18576.1 putative uridine nucleosidase [Mollisia scopiformis]
MMYDAFAILMSAYHPSLNLLGITTVHGNSSLPHTTHNALSLLTAIGAPSIPVYPGSANGLTRPAVHAPAIHGASGLDGTTLLPTPINTHATEPFIEAMSTALLSTPKGTAWLIATGALTNIALLFEQHPEVAEHIKGLSLMGGAIGGGFTNAPMGKVDDRERIGNWSAWAEFNILVDPEAAQALFSNPVLRTKMVMIPLDVTHLVLATGEVQSLLLHGKGGGAASVLEDGKVGEGKSTLRKMLVELLLFFAKTYKDVFGIEEGPPLHDPLAVAVILDGIAGAEIPFYDFEDGKDRKERYDVHVVTEGSHEEAQNGAETGRTIVKLLPEGEEGVKIPRNLDVKRFWGVLEDSLERANAVNRANGVS